MWTLCDEMDRNFAASFRMMDDDDFFDDERRLFSRVGQSRTRESQ